MACDAGRPYQRSQQPSSIGITRQGLARNSADPSAQLSKAEIRGAAYMDGDRKFDVIGRGIQVDVAGRRGALYRQPTIDGAFHCATQLATAEAVDLSHHRLPSGMPHRGTRT